MLKPENIKTAKKITNELYDYLDHNKKLSKTEIDFIYGSVYFLILKIAMLQNSILDDTTKKSPKKRRCRSSMRVPKLHRKHKEEDVHFNF
jgi:hypothetical protein